MKKSFTVRAMCIALSACLIILLSGCAIQPQKQNINRSPDKSGKTYDLTEGILPGEPCKVSELDSETTNSVSDFSVALFQNSFNKDKNTLISPYSVVTALGMAADGANGNTLEEMEKVFGISSEELNDWLYAYSSALPNSQNSSLKVANSIWFKDSQTLSVNRDFLQNAANICKAQIFKAPFNDGTLEDINAWVNDNTDGMIKEILDKLPSGAVMCLINALSFNAEWAEKYEDNCCRDGKFTEENGAKYDVKFMYSSESNYISDDKSQGFIKYYSGGKYAFAAILPNEGVSVSDYVNTLTGEKLQKLLKGSDDSITVRASMPEFKTEYKADLDMLLKSMGMKDAFDERKADFSGIGNSTEGNIYISRIVHKTFIEVTQSGTKAGAVTAVVMDAGAAYTPPENIKKIDLNRPFLYMIIDTENNVPLFMGTLMSAKS